MTKPKQNFPGSIFVRFTNDSEGEYPLAFEHENDAVEDGGVTPVATYQLFEVRRLTKIVTEKIVISDKKGA